MANIDQVDQAKREAARLALARRQEVKNAVRRARESRKSYSAKKEDEYDKRVDRLRYETRMALISPSDKSGLERVIGTSNIVAISYLHRALTAARSVCRIKVAGTAGEPPIFGTGFLIAPGLLVTNNHVLRDETTASSAIAEFNYELDLNWVERQRHYFAIVPSRVFFTDQALDITIVGVAPVAHDGTPITEYGTLKLIPNSGKALDGEFVSIIQHPQGEPKQVVIRENRIIKLDPELFESNDNFIHYTADTEAGSSGSPVFNDQWDLVAVHHKSIPDLLPNGEQKNKANNKPWEPQDGERARAWLANEGIRVSSIVRSILLARDDDPHAARIAAILAFEPPTQMRNDCRAWGTARYPEDPSAYPELPAFESTSFNNPAFKNDMGFDTGFLGKKLPVALPTLANRKSVKDVCFIPKGTNSPVLDYTHFSLAMHKARKLALWTAVNIDGKNAYLKKVSDVGWRKDKRAEDCQTFGAVYGKNRGGTNVQLDKGHQVRRLDPVWGPKAVAERAAKDTFHYTNAVPQEHVFNSEIWGNLEDFVLDRAINQKQKASVLTGPVLGKNDKLFDDGNAKWKVPKSFWKICAFIRSDGTPSVTGFVMEQGDEISPLFEANRFNPFTVEEVRVFQKKISEIEKLTGLDFGALKKHDKMGVVESTAAGKPRPLRSIDDIVF